MAFNCNFYKGTSANDLKKIFNYKEFMISDQEAERLASNSQRLILESMNQEEKKDNTVDIVPTIKNEVISNQ